MFAKIARFAARAVTTGARDLSIAAHRARTAVTAARTDRERIVTGPVVDNPPTADEIATAAQVHEDARVTYNEGARIKRAARKVLDRAQTGEYGDWSVSWVQSSRREWDRDAITEVFAEIGREIPTRATDPRLKLTRAAIADATVDVPELVAA